MQHSCLTRCVIEVYYFGVFVIHKHGITAYLCRMMNRLIITRGGVLFVGLFLFLLFHSCTNPATDSPTVDIPIGMTWIEGNEGRPGFFMDITEVTTAQFGQFVKQTDYVTEAEEFGWSGVFDKDSLTWLPVNGAFWRYPVGPDSAAAAPEHPVTQISIRDIRAYAQWSGKRLPTESEWVWAASQEGKHVRFPWGDEMKPGGKYLGNWWQGPFPYQDNVLDGFPGIAPVKSFPPAANGLYDLSGNVWEWTATRAADGQYVIKGGSFLCSTSYCTGFDFQQRQLTPEDSGLNHLGFRLVLDPEAR